MARSRANDSPREAIDRALVNNDAVTLAVVGSDHEGPALLTLTPRRSSQGQRPTMRARTHRGARHEVRSPW